MEDSYFATNFNTQLTQPEEDDFSRWLDEAKNKYGVDLVSDMETYDLRGFFKSGGKNDTAFMQRKGHAPDTFKKPNHPTFSNESIYSGATSPMGGEFKGGEWVSEDMFMPSREMLSTTHPIDWLKNYLREYGEGVKIVEPTESVYNGTRR